MSLIVIATIKKYRYLFYATLKTAANRGAAS